jgi:uncharacterized protein
MITLPSPLGLITPGSTVSLAVTGLSRAGKTVFITSLIHNLISAVHNPNRMPLLGAVAERRLLGAKVLGAGAHKLPRFPYKANIERMAVKPWEWPERTADISEIELDIRFESTGLFSRLLEGVTGQPASLTLRIVDYPGEWLLDLPLLTQSYAEWSRMTLQRWRKGSRASIARDFLEFVQQHRHDGSADEDVAKQAHDLYCTMMRTARDEHGLTYLQPGRFLWRGTLVDAPYLWFAPLDVSGDIEMLAPGTLGELMQQRYEVYREQVVADFFDNHFRHYSRQIVLVDVLHALLAGHDAFEDTRLALESIMESFRYGRGSILARLFGIDSIEKVMFAATKADHVPSPQRDNLAELLRHMAAVPAIEVKGANAAVAVEAIASVISTAEDSHEIDGQRVQVVVGKPVGSEFREKFFVGNVPIRPPRADAWATPFLTVPNFQPPEIDVAPVEGIPHINLDVALDFLLGDRLR